MKLLIVSLGFAIWGFFLGLSIEVEISPGIFSLMGFLCPSVYVLGEFYNKSFKATTNNSDLKNIDSKENCLKK